MSRQTATVDPLMNPSAPKSAPEKGKEPQASSVAPKAVVTASKQSIASNTPASVATSSAAPSGNASPTPNARRIDPFQMTFKAAPVLKVSDDPLWKKSDAGEDDLFGAPSTTNETSLFDDDQLFGTSQTSKTSPASTKPTTKVFDNAPVHEDELDEALIREAKTDDLFVPAASRTTDTVLFQETPKKELEVDRERAKSYTIGNEDLGHIEKKLATENKPKIVQSSLHIAKPSAAVCLDDDLFSLVDSKPSGTGSAQARKSAGVGDLDIEEYIARSKSSSSASRGLFDE